MSKKVSVGLVILTEIPDIGLVAVCQDRGRFNTEKMEPESWPGGCQVAVHGKSEEGESLFQTLFREAREELGEKFADTLIAHQALEELAGRIAIVELNCLDDEDKIVVTFAVEVDYYSIYNIRLSSSSGGLRYITRSETETILDLNSFDKKNGVNHRSVVAMFPDEKEALGKAFVLFG